MSSKPKRRRAGSASPPRISDGAPSTNSINRSPALAAAASLISKMLGRATEPPAPPIGRQGNPAPVSQRASAGLAAAALSLSPIIHPPLAPILRKEVRDSANPSKGRDYQDVEKTKGS